MCSGAGWGEVVLCGVAGVGLVDGVGWSRAWGYGSFIWLFCLFACFLGS